MAEFESNDQVNQGLAATTLTQKVSIVIVTSLQLMTLVPNMFRLSRGKSYYTTPNTVLQTNQRLAFAWYRTDRPTKSVARVAARYSERRRDISRELRILKGLVCNNQRFPRQSTVGGDHGEQCQFQSQSV